MLAGDGDDPREPFAPSPRQARTATGSTSAVARPTGAEKWRLLAASQICVMPSRYETFGLTALEALACGTPVVAFDIESLRGNRREWHGSARAAVRRGRLGGTAIADPRTGTRAATAQGVDVMPPAIAAEMRAWPRSRLPSAAARSAPRPSQTAPPRLPVTVGPPQQGGLLVGACAGRRVLLPVGVFAVTVGLRLFHLRTSYDVFLDESIYSTHLSAANWPRTRRLVFGNYPFYLHGPLSFYLQAFVIRVFGIGGTAIDVIERLRVFNVLVAGGVAVLVYAIVRAISRPRWGLLAAALFACDPFIISFDSRLFLETLATFWVLLGFYLLLPARCRARHGGGHERAAACAPGAPSRAASPSASRCSPRRPRHRCTCCRCSSASSAAARCGEGPPPRRSGPRL